MQDMSDKEFRKGQERIALLGLLGLFLALVADALTHSFVWMMVVFWSAFLSWYMWLSARWVGRYVRVWFRKLRTAI